jgi:hypothetical protein
MKLNFDHLYEQIELYLSNPQSLKLQSVCTYCVTLHFIILHSLYQSSSLSLHTSFS